MSTQNTKGDLLVTYQREGDYIFFGEYPQSLKAPDVMINENITDDNGYYFGDDGFFYLKAQAKPYNDKAFFATGEPIVEGQYYYFKIEPIRWRVLEEKNGAVFLFCDNIIAYRRFHPKSADYGRSEIRSWLCHKFFKEAFNVEQRKMILTTKIKREFRTEQFFLSKLLWADSKDKIFLLSQEEVTNAAYGFNPSAQEMDDMRQKVANDYVRAMGFSYIMSGYWWLRSSCSKRVLLCGDQSGYASGHARADFAQAGVVPALKLKL